MQRNISDFMDHPLDVLVIGAGIHGACLAREAALRGLRTGIIDRSDFGAATSANSLKIIHGGLRYLQKLDLKRTRQTQAECRTLLRIAPHLVHPLPCVLPTYGSGRRSRAAMGLGLRLYRALGPRRTAADLPAGRLISRAELLILFEGLTGQPGITGGLLWYDAQVYNSERLTLAFIRSAVEEGAVAANYVEARRLLVRDSRVVGVVCRDALGEAEFEIRARFVINAAGPWWAGVVRSGGLASPGDGPSLVKGWNVITRPLHPTHLLGVSRVTPGPVGRRFGRMLVIAPWRGHSIVGTMYARSSADEAPRVTDAEVQRLLDEINAAYPAAQLGPEHVLLHHVGLLPADPHAPPRDPDRLLEQWRIIDHEREDRVPGIASVIGVKYTTARKVAEQTLDLVCARLDHRTAALDSSRVPVDGGDLDSLAEHEVTLRQQAPPSLDAAVTRLARNYGTRAAELIGHCHRHPEAALPVSAGAETTRAEVQYAVRHEMAVKLADVVLRRTELGIEGLPPPGALEAMAKIMGEQLGWGPDRLMSEATEVQRFYQGVIQTPESCHFDGGARHEMPGVQSRSPRGQMPVSGRVQT